MCNNFCMCILVYSLALLVNCEEFHVPKHPATFNRHALVRPIVHHARTKRQLSTTRQESGLHHNELLVTVDVESEPYTLDLKLNQGLLPEGHTISYQEGGKTVLHKPRKEEIDLCQYTGHVQGKPNSWAALSTCDGLRGAIHDGTKIRYMEPSEGSDLQTLHYIYEQDDVKTERRCGNDDLYPYKDSVNKHMQLTKEPSQQNNTHMARHKRETSFPIREGPFNANKRSRYVELVLVTDYAIYRGVNGDLKRLYRQLQDTTNILHAIYAPLNIFIALTGVEVWTTGDRIALSSNGSVTLDNFMQYRRTVLLKNTPQHDHAHLITAQKFDSGVVGQAYVSKMGSFEQSGAVIHRPAYHVTAATIFSTAGTMAHEMGHSFGMSHDTEDSRCRDQFCIMHKAAVSPIPTHFSENSLKELMLGFYQGIDYELRNKPKRLFGSPSCGNGFVDPGEECDCGVRVEGIEPSGCHRCCNPNTCRLRSNAICVTGACCNLETCQMMPVATLCRAAERDCDLPEYCSGDSEYCPEDVFKMDTTPCSDKAYCVQGKCRSHEAQCRLLWGSPAKNGRRDCYSKNTIGDEISNCGYDVLTTRSQPCEKRHAICGRLYCHHFNKRLEFGNFNSRRKSFYSMSYATGIHICEAVRFDSVSSEDPGMVPDGAECGTGQMCLQQRCVRVDHVRAHVVQRQSEGCRANCSGHGICNSKGLCHCDDGFSPPLCDLPGVGGSDDSGPAGDPNVLKKFKIVMYIIFLGIVPLVAFILLLIYFMKRKSLLCFKQNTKFHRFMNTTTTVKKAVLSLLNKKDGNIKSTNISTNLNRNARPESVKSTPRHEIKIIRNSKAETALLSKFDVNSYVNCRNGTQGSVTKISNEDIKVIISGTVEDVQKPLLNDDNNYKRNHSCLRNVIKSPTIDVKVENSPKSTPDNNIKNNAVNSLGNAENNIVSDASVVKQTAVFTDKVKVDIKPKTINNVKPIFHSRSLNHNQVFNIKSKTYGNIESRSQYMHTQVNELNSLALFAHTMPSTKLPIEKNIPDEVSDIRTVKNKIETNVNDIKCKPNEKGLPVNKPIPHQKPTKLNQTYTTGTKPSKDVNKVVSKNTLEPWPKLKPMKKRSDIAKTNC